MARFPVYKLGNAGYLHFINKRMEIPMTMQIVKSSKPTKRTWLGRAGTETTHYFDRKFLGLRMVVIEWEDDGSTQYRLIEGDGRKTDFKVFMEVTL